MTGYHACHVVICDDERGRRDHWKSEIERELGSAVTVEVVGDWAREWEILLARRKRARTVGDDVEQPQHRSFEELPIEDDFEDETAFDRADVLLVDYDLFGFDPDNYLTGAVVSYVVRCYSSCRVIVSVNEFGPNPFDLSLRPDPGSFADLSIGEEQVSSLGLWHGDVGNAFRPWAWPPLLRLAGLQGARAGLAAAEPHAHVVDVCGIGEDYEFLPRSVLGLLERHGEPGQKTTLVELAIGPRLGYRSGDEPPSKQAVARVAAARAARWLEAFVLPLQETLIDIPHLAARNPTILKAGHGGFEATVAFGKTAAQLGVIDELLRWEAPTGPWLSRPALRWFRVRNDAASRTRRRSREDDPVVFCEDISAFVSETQARRFVSALDSSSAVRWITNPDLVGIEGLDRVQYRPLSRLAL